MLGNAVNLYPMCALMTFRLINNTQVHCKSSNVIAKETSHVFVPLSAWKTKPYVDCKPTMNVLHSANGRLKTALFTALVIMPYPKKHVLSFKW